RTVGWFTSIYPFVLDVSTTEKRSDSLVQVKESLRKVPNKGIGYGMLKYLTDDFDGSISPSIVFNYLGDFGDGIGNSETSLFEYCSDDIGLSSSSDNGQDTVLDISGMMSSGRLSMSIRYSDDLYDQSTIASLIASYKSHLEVLIGELSEEEQNHLTPSDLTFRDLSIDELTALNKAGDVEDVYELSPLQQGIYYHWLSNNDTSLYFEQMSYRLRAESLDVNLIHQGYDELVKRHSVLRTSFTNDYGGTPLQVVRKDIPSDFSYEQAPEGLVGDALDAYVETMKLEDRSKGFDLEGGSSQMRLKVLDLGSGSYEFIWSHHHILMDGWCMSILINDFYELMGSIDQNREVNLPTPVRYSSYIDWLSKVNKEESLTYWREYLEGYDHISEVPFKVKEGDASRYTERRNTLKIEGNLYEKVNTFCNDLGITQNTFIQGVWGYLLSRYNNTQDVVFGSVVSGRPADLSGVEDMIGLFSNTIPVRINYQSDDTPLSLLKSLQDESISSTSHHYLNLSEVQSESELGMDLINHIMIFENFPIQEAIKDDITETKNEKEKAAKIETIEAFDQSSYGFNIVVAPFQSSLSIKFRYDSQQYDTESIDNLVQHFYNVIQNFVEAREQSLDTFNYLEKEETNKLLDVFNDTAVEYPKNKTLIDLFEEQVLRTPSNVALIFGDKEFTYKELDEKSNQLAHCLKKEHFVEQGDVIGVHLDRSDWVIVSILAILKAGGVYVPIVPDLPEARKEHIINDTQLKLLLTETSYMFDLGFYDGNTFAVDVEFEASDYDLLSLDTRVTIHDLAYIIYTSGSTGMPKGVMIEHKGIVNTILSQIDIFNLKECKRSLQFASFSFDASISEIFITLLSGSSLYLMGDEMRKDPGLLEDYMYDKEIEVATIPPSYLKLMNIEKLQKLKVLVTAGESPVYDKVAEYLQYGTYCNAYGPTETSICGTVFKANKGTVLGSDVIPIGTPISNAGVYILDQFDMLQPIGVPGEICISGAGLSKGYLNHSDLTETKFIDHPFVAGELLYRTGDVGRWLTNGNIEFLGRKDHQVKIRGHRIELGEIEHQLLLKEDILEAVVLAVDKGEEKELVAYVVSENDQNVDDLRKYLSKALPEYMLPAYFVQLEKIPLTINGKTDKKKLPDPEGIKMSSGKNYLAPKTTEEKLLVSVWEDVLQTKSISISDSFYSLGGDSIKLLKIISGLKGYGYTLKMQDLLRKPKIEDLAKVITKIETTEDQLVVPNETWEIGCEIEVSKNQHYYLRSKYFQSTISTLVDNYNENTFESRFRGFLSNFPVLCVKFKEQEGRIIQKRISSDDVKLKIETKKVSRIGRKKKINKLIDSHFKQSFEIFEGELIRVLILTGGKDEKPLVIVGMYHALTDGYTSGKIEKDLRAYFSGNKIEARPASNFDFVTWQKQFLVSEEGMKQRAYWIDLIENSSLSRETSESRTELTEFVIQKNIISGENFNLVKEVANRLELPISALFLGFHQKLLNNIGFQNKCLQGIMVNGREQIINGIDISKLLGVIDNLLPLPLLDINNNNEIEFIQAVYSQYLESRTYQQIPYVVIRHDVKEKYNRDIDTSLAGRLNFQDWEDSILKKEIKETLVKTEKSNWLKGVHLNCIVHSNGIEVSLISSKDIYESKEDHLSLDTFINNILKLK
ncbi:amino acid adenylation domain-containing protein, partial [Aquimarina litoralis]|uniref:amino acid adenylation domain-containing protein n=1 Tax=Aquimarina litoralis TaxID=584605 RepID=UPI0031D5C294